VSAAAPGPGLALETATDHVEVLVCGDAGAVLAHEAEDVAHGHVRRLAALVERALGRAAVRADALRWVAADLGPGSFTGVRVGLASAEALALAAGAELLGASSLGALAHAAGARRALVVPLVPAGRRDLYAGFHRADARGTVVPVAAPRVGSVGEVLAAVAEVHPLLERATVRFVGPGAARERAALEAEWPGSTAPPRRFEGLSALDLAAAAHAARRALLGGPPPGSAPHPVYVRPPQAEERVRRAALAGERVTLRGFAAADAAHVAAIEREVFSDPWPEAFFTGALAHPMAHARVAVRAEAPDGAPHGGILGYSVAWLGAGDGHLDNLAVVPAARRRGIARLLLEDVLDRARAAGDTRLTLEVRATNAAAQALYRAYGFRLAGLRRGYYRDNGEDALVMEWRSR
jgi:tRNA threonylcarbamoyl adenosine modification protein YeaZ/ribosomal-protein-alanine acetyltransferase